MPDLTTLAAVKDYLELDPDFTAHDKRLKRLIKAMSQTFVNRTRRDIINTTKTEQLSGDDARVRIKSYVGPYLTWLRSGVVGYQLELRYTPVVSLQSLMIDGVAVVAATNFGQPTQTDGYVVIDGHQLVLVGSTYTFTRGVGNVMIQYTAGYGAVVPDDVEECVIEMVAWRYRTGPRLGQTQKTTGMETIAFSQADFPASVLEVITTYMQVNL